MTTWNPRANDLFLKALELCSDGARQEYLDGACAGDAALRAEVESLLEATGRAGAFLEFPAPALLLAAKAEEPLREGPGTVIGSFKLLEQIGEGGFGVVFMAEQEAPLRRKVALKVLKPGMDSKQVVARFEAERQALALMDHPHIAHVYGGGETASGRPYFVMELVRGVPVTDFCDQNRLGVRERLGLFLDVCQAVQHAHQKGVIHRDLKPPNVLVTLHDDKPVVKVIDFGIAKATGQQLTEKTLFTNFAQMIGTPLYMSPEQAQMSGLDVDTRSDVYSLGVLLYELLTGTTPFDRERLRAVGYDEIRRIIREEEPARPSTRISTLGQAASTVSANRQSDPGRLSELFRGELDWIVMKALEKDRNRRYESAGAFAADVQRYLADEPVHACPPSAGYRLRKFARRNKGVLTATMLIAIALVVGMVVSAWQASNANARRLEAETARHEAIANLQHAREAVDQMLTRVSEEKLLNTPQMELLRKALLEDALKFYQRFLRQAGSDPAIRLGTGEAYRRTGQIYQRLGQPDQAERAHREALALLEKLLTDSPTDPANRVALALSYNGLGSALSDLGRYAESESALRRAIGMMQGLIADFPEHDDYPRMRTAMEADLAWVSERLIRVAGKRKTEAFYRENLRLQEKLLAAAPNDPERRHAVTYAQIELGSCLHRGQPQEAERLYRDAIAGNMKLTSQFPHTAEYRTNLADACHGLFLLLRADRRFKEAEEVYREALPHIDKVVADAPRVPYPRRLLIEHYWDYALMLEAAGRPQEADKALQQAITGAEAMWKEFPTYAWAPARLAVVYIHVGNKHQIDGRFSQAEAAYRKALDVSEKSVRALPHKELRCRLADSCLNLGLLLKMSERHKEAASVFRKLFEAELTSADLCNDVAWRLATDTDLKLRPPELAVEFARKAVELASEDGNVWNTLGVAQLRAGNWKESITTLQKSNDLRKGGDSFNWFFLAMAHWHLGDKDEARKWYNHGVQWMEKNQPKNEELRRFRAEAAELLGIEKKKD
jgi:serine/threonine protein kinase/tetratricopeptide (TPR) repeat protein